MREEAEAIARERGWPSHVRAMDMDSLGDLGIDDEHRIYWQGKPIEIAKPVSLTRNQTIFAIAGLILTAIGVMAACASAWADVQNYVDQKDQVVHHEKAKE